MEALVILLNVSLLIRGPMQYEARKNLRELDEVPKIGVGGRKPDRPTSENLIYLLRLYNIHYDGKTHYLAGINNLKNAERFTIILTLLDVDKKELFPNAA
jgi:hypothetical protein